MNLVFAFSGTTHCSLRVCAVQSFGDFGCVFRRRSEALFFCRSEAQMPGDAIHTRLLGAVERSDGSALASRIAIFTSDRGADFRK